MAIYMWREPYTPGSNTVAYFPLVNDQLDKVGSASINLTGTKQYVGYSFDADNSNVIQVTGLTDKVYFASLWTKFIRKSTTHDTNTFFTNAGGTRFVWLDTNDSSVSGKFMYVNSSGTFIKSSSSYGHDYNTWYHLAFGFKNNQFFAFHNGTLVRSGSATPRDDGVGVVTLLGNKGGSAWFSDVILESEIPTAQEVQDYYNLTKGLYGIN